MPKVSKVGKFRQTAAAAAVVAAASPSGVDPVDENGLSRGQRKRQAKKDQYLKRQKLVLSTLLLQKQEDQKKRIDGLDALKEALQATLTENETASGSQSPKDAPDFSQHLNNTNKSKKQLTAREVSHLSLVLEHPAFQSNPFATIQEHLKNTLAGQAKELEKEGKEKEKIKATLAKKRKKIKKARQRADGGKHRKKFRATRTRK
jgi:Ribosome biogenesis protein SLX9